eukprot:TRINITY_DN33537_c0_g1_i1.p1 TRINITY_DN33537_c0_g1~~TRINITY_DN33537_c0_g1_i1.p1  ORF type:complete len:171 (-),score=18.98 TRINITY_DN33537_c0_g1_i1:117-572(-)
MPVPYLEGWRYWLYLLAFLCTYLVVLPMGEEAFYRVFQANQWKGFASDVMISFFYAGMNAAALVHILEEWQAVLLFSTLAFLSGLVLVTIRDNLSVVYSLMTRIGIALGMLLWIFFLYESAKNQLPRQQPEYFFGTNTENVFFMTPSVTAE